MTSIKQRCIIALIGLSLNPLSYATTVTLSSSDTSAAQATPGRNTIRIGKCCEYQCCHYV
jgi:hypothetical protein